MQILCGAGATKSYKITKARSRQRSSKSNSIDKGNKKEAFNANSKKENEAGQQEEEIRTKKEKKKTENWFLPFPFQIQLLSENAKREAAEGERDGDRAGLWGIYSKTVAPRKRQHLPHATEEEATPLPPLTPLPNHIPQQKSKGRSREKRADAARQTNDCVFLLLFVCLGKVSVFRACLKIFENCICCARRSCRRFAVGVDAISNFADLWPQQQLKEKKKQNRQSTSRLSGVWLQL